jgi:hypothetical protein
MIVIIDGPPAAGKSSVVRLLRQKYRAPAFLYKRLGLVNVLYMLLLMVAPNLQCNRISRENVDHIMLVNQVYLVRMPTLTLGLEVLYKCIRYCLLLFLALTRRNLVVDEGFSLGWANYLNLRIFKKALKHNHIALLMRLDLQYLRLLSSIHKVYYYFIDRDQGKLSTLWRRKGHRAIYDKKYSFLVRCSFKFFEEMYEKYGIKARVKCIYIL